MCGRYSLQADAAQLAIELDAVDRASRPEPGMVPDAAPRAPRFNIAPTTTIPVLTAGAENRELLAMRWGLVPSWTKDPKKLPNLFNARVETAAEKPSFRAAVRRRHAAIPMDGWYEWVPQPDGKGRKQPFFMSAPGDAGLLMAGLWESWTVLDDDRDAEDLFAHADAAAAAAGEVPERRMYSATILTTDAVGPLRRVHDRMPLVLRADAVADWLSGEIGDPRELVDEEALAAWAESVEIRPVSTAVSAVRNDAPELLAPVEAPDWWDAP